MPDDPAGARLDLNAPNNWILADQSHVHFFKPAFRAVHKFNGLMFTHIRGLCSCGVTQDNHEWSLETDPDYEFDWKPIDD